MNDISDKKILYHGTNVVIKQPYFDSGRIDVDFGRGFYLTADKRMAQKWSCNKTPSIVNEYEVDLKGLRIKNLMPLDEWLDFVIFNRTKAGLCPFNGDDFDVIIGPTADDRLFATLDLYSDGVISKEQTIRVINCINYSDQVVFKNNEAIKKGVRFVGSKELKGLERQDIYDQMIVDRKQANVKAMELIRGGRR